MALVESHTNKYKNRGVMLMNNQKQMSARDIKVEVRNKMASSLSKGVENLNKGDRRHLATTLKYIHNDFKRGFTVDSKPSKTIELFNIDYGVQDGLIIIQEDGKDLMAIFRVRDGECKGEWRITELSYYEFQYDEELEAEAKWESEAESAYERYYDYQAFMRSLHEDPRGQ
jgi:hypothetical protein